MKRIKFEAVLEYEPDLVHGTNADAIQWFIEKVLQGELILHSNEIGDEVGTIHDFRIIDAP